MATLNIGMKVNRVISGATTVNANAMAIVTYTVSSMSGTLSGAQGLIGIPPVTRFFGPGQSIPGSFTSGIGGASNSGYNISAYGSATYALVSGVELINTI